MNLEGFPKWMIDNCDVFASFPETLSMRQPENTPHHQKDWLDTTRLNALQVLQDRAHQASTNNVQKSYLMQNASLPNNMMNEYNEYRVPVRRDRRFKANDF